MMLLWMAYATAVAAILCGAAQVAERTLRGRGRAGRWVWLGALVGSLVLPLLGVGARSAGEPGEVPGPRGVVLDVTAVVRPGPSAPVGPARWLREARRRLEVVDGPVTLGWLAGSGALALVVLLGAAGVARERRGWLAVRMGRSRVLLSPATGPAVVGVRRPTIVLPRWALRLEQGALALVLAHEEEHVGARDTALLAAGLAALVVMPWNPALWWGFRRLRLAVEVDCDRRVLGRGVEEVRYGRLLLEMGRRGRAGLPVVALAEPRDFLERRLEMITKRGAPIGWVRGAVSLAGAGVLLALACELPAPAGPAEEAAVSTFTAREVAAPGGLFRMEALAPKFGRSGDVIELHEAAPEREPGEATFRAEEVRLREKQASRAGVGGAAESGTHRMRGAISEGRSRVRLLPDGSDADLDAPHHALWPAVEVDGSGRVRVGDREVELEELDRTFRTLAEAYGSGLLLTVQSERKDAERTLQVVELATAAGIGPVELVLTGDPVDARDVGEEVRVHGASPGDPVVYVDGEKVEDGAAALDGLDPQRIERVEVLKGDAAVAVDTDATEGVIRIFTKDGEGLRPRS